MSNDEKSKTNLIGTCCHHCHWKSSRQTLKRKCSMITVTKHGVCSVVKELTAVSMCTGNSSGCCCCMSLSEVFDSLCRRGLYSKCSIICSRPHLRDIQKRNNMTEIIYLFNAVTSCIVTSKHRQTISTAQIVSKRIGLSLKIVIIMSGVGNSVPVRPGYDISTTLKSSDLGPSMNLHSSVLSGPKV